MGKFCFLLNLNNIQCISCLGEFKTGQNSLHKIALHATYQTCFQWLSHPPLCQNHSQLLVGPSEPL